MPSPVRKAIRYSLAYLYLQGIWLHRYQKGTFILPTLQMEKLKLRGVKKPALKIQLTDSHFSILAVKQSTILPHQCDLGRHWRGPICGNPELSR